MEVKLDLWHRSQLQELADRAVDVKLSRPAHNRSKKTKNALRTVALLCHNKFAHAVGLAESKGAADAIPVALIALQTLFKEQGVVDHATLRRLYGPKVTPTRATTVVNITVHMVKDSLAAVAPLTTPPKKGWRAEHLLALAEEQDCAAAITDFVGALVAGDVTDSTCDFLFSATLVIFLKKTEEEMADMRASLGEAYL